MAQKDESVGMLEDEAFKLLYPKEYIERFFKEGIHPDGRPLGRARATSVGLGALSSADGSALVKIGNTAMLAGVKLEIFVPPTEEPEQGRVAIEFVMPPLCSPNARPGKPQEVSYAISEQISKIIKSSNFLNLEKLCIVKNQAAWIAYLDIYCLDADGALLDCALLAAVSALADLKFPPVNISESGQVTKIVTNLDSTENTNVHLQDSTVQSDGSGLGHVSLPAVPFSLTLSIQNDKIIVDPNADEEPLSDCIVTIALDQSDRFISFSKSGGKTVNVTLIQDCFELAKLRYKELKTILLNSISKEGMEEEEEESDVSDMEEK